MLSIIGKTNNKQEQEPAVTGSGQSITRSGAWIRILTICAILALMLSSCKRYEPAALSGEYDKAILESSSIAITDETGETDETQTEQETSTEETDAAVPEAEDTRVPVKVKGIYLASKPLNNESLMAELWGHMDETELNAVVIDIKDDYGMVTYDMQGLEILDELQSVRIDIKDMPSLMNTFKEHGIYTIARIVSLRDPHIGDVKPEWCLTNPDGTVYTDNSGYTWANPYKDEYWDYLLNIAKRCAEDGFDEIQFDYIRFCTDRGADECVFDEAEVRGRDKISIITEKVQYLSDNLKPLGVYVSCDVFGTIIGSRIDSRLVGQDYTVMSTIVDYMCPMIYPSHYAAGNFGLDMPDKHPYESILGALKLSKSVLSKSQTDGEKQAVVRPWLQSFTASWLGSGNYIEYDAEAVRKEIQAVYDAGYDEWILWSVSVSYDYSGILSKEEGEAEYERILESRAALPPEETAEDPAETFPSELSDALDGEDLSEEDKAILEQDGPIITYE